MVDPLFGSHYIQSAIDLAILAGGQLSDKPRVIPNIDEAIRLYEAAIEDMKLGIKEVDPKSIVKDGLARIKIWESKIQRLKSGEYVHG